MTSEVWPILQKVISPAARSHFDPPKYLHFRSGTSRVQEYCFGNAPCGTFSLLLRTKCRYIMAMLREPFEVVSAFVSSERFGGRES
jgi:hypothetical protein